MKIPYHSLMASTLLLSSSPGADASISAAVDNEQVTNAASILYTLSFRRLHSTLLPRSPATASPTTSHVKPCSASIISAPATRTATLSCCPGYSAAAAAAASSLLHNASSVPRAAGASCSSTSVCRHRPLEAPGRVRDAPLTRLSATSSGTSAAAAAVILRHANPPPPYRVLSNSSFPKTVASASPPTAAALRGSTSPSKENSASSSSGVVAKMQPQQAAAAAAPALLPAAAASSSSSSSTGGAVIQRRVCARREHPTTSSAVISSSSSSVLSSTPQSSFPSRSAVSQVVYRGGIPLLPFIRPAGSASFHYMRLSEYRRNEDSSSFRTDFKISPQNNASAGVSRSSCSKGLPSPGKPISTSESNSSNTVQDAGKDKNSPLQTAKAHLPRAILLLSQQEESTHKTEGVPTQHKNKQQQQQKAPQRQVQNVMRHRHDQQVKQQSPQGSRQQSLFGFENDSQADARKLYKPVKNEMKESPTQSNSQPIKETKQSPIQSKSQQQQYSMISWQVQNPLTHQDHHQLTSQPQPAHDIHKDHKHVSATEQQQPLVLHQHHPISQGWKQVNPSRKQLSMEVYGTPDATAEASMPLPTSCSRTLKQLKCYVCLSEARVATTTAVDNQVAHTYFSNRRNVLPASASSVSTAASATIVSCLAAESVNPRAAVSDSKRVHVPPAFECTYLSHEESTFCETIPTNDCTSDPSTSSSGKSRDTAYSNRYERLIRAEGSGNYRISSAPSSVVGYNANKLTKTETNIVDDANENNTRGYCFYDVGGLILCQRCALMPGVHTTSQVNTLLEEALCYLKEEAGINFNHPVLIQLHRLVLGSSSSSSSGSNFSSDYAGNSSSSSSRNSSSTTTRISRRGRVSDSFDINNDCKSTHSSRIADGECCRSRNGTSNPKQNVPSACSSNNTDSDSNLGGLSSSSNRGFDCTSIDSDTDITTSTRKREHEGVAVDLRSNYPLEDENITSIADNKKENESRRKNRRGEDGAEENESKRKNHGGEDGAQLGGRSKAWEFPFYVEAVNLSTLLQPPCMMEVTPAAISPPPAAASISETASPSAVGQYRTSAITAIPANVAGFAAVEAPVTAVGIAPQTSNRNTTALAPGARLTARQETALPTSEHLIHSSSNRTKNIQCLPLRRSSTCDLQSHSAEGYSCAAPCYIYASDQGTVSVKQEVPDRIVFGRCETLKVYFSQKTLPKNSPALPTRSTGASRQVGQKRDAAKTPATPDESIKDSSAPIAGGAVRAAGVAPTAGDQYEINRRQVESYVPPMTEAPPTAAVPVHAITKPQETVSLARQRKQPALGQERRFGDAVSLEASEVLKVSGQHGSVLSAQEESSAEAPGGQEISEEVASNKSTATASVELSEKGEAHTTGTHPATLTGESLTGAKKQYSSEGEEIHTRASSDRVVWGTVICRRPRLKETRTLEQSGTEGVERKEEQTDRLKGILRKEAAGQVGDLRGGAGRSTEATPEQRKVEERHRCADEDDLPREAWPTPAATGDILSQPAAAGAAGEVAHTSRSPQEPKALGGGDGEALARTKQSGGNYFTAEGRTSAHHFSHRASKYVPAVSVGCLSCRMDVKTSRGVLRCRKCELRPLQAEGDRSMLLHSGQHAAAAAGEETDEPLIRGTAEGAAAPGVINSPFQPVVYRVAVARGLPEAVFLAHLGHELLHAYIWCTTFNTATPSAVVHTEEENEKNLIESDLKTNNPRPPQQESCHLPDGDSMASTWVAAIHDEVTNPGEERKEKDDDIAKDMQERRQQEVCCAVSSHVALTNLGRSAQTHMAEKSEERKRQQLQEKTGFYAAPAAAATPLHRFPPLDLALEEGICNCVAAGLLEHRAAALSLRLRQLLATVPISISEGQSRFSRSVPNNIAPFVTRHSCSIKCTADRLFKGSDAPREKKDEESLRLVPSLQRHDIRPPYVGRREKRHLVVGESEQEVTKHCMGMYSRRDKASQVLLQRWHHRCPLEEHAVLDPQQEEHHEQHCKQQMMLMKKRHRCFHGQCEPRLTQQQQATTQLCTQRTLGEPLEKSQGCCEEEQRSQRAGQQQVSCCEEDVEEEVELCEDRSHGNQCQLQDKCSVLPPRREPLSQDARKSVTTPHQTKLRESHLHKHTLQQEILLCTHELRVIQIRLRLMETDSHEIYGSSYKTVRHVMKRIGLEKLLETARKGQLQHLMRKSVPG